MNELKLTLIGNSAAASPNHILESLSDALAHTHTPGAPHTIYEELWHLAFWQQMTLDWVRGIETAVPEHASSGFPAPENIAAEDWKHLCCRFLDGTQEAAAITQDEAMLDESIRCPSPPGKPIRTMTVREQLESLTAHNAYHLGRIVLLRQLHQSWPPPSGGFTW